MTTNEITTKETQIDKKECHHCQMRGEILELCIDCFYEKNPSDGILDVQRSILWNLYKNIFVSDKYFSGLYGLAGSGKTMMIKFLLQFNLSELLKKDKCRIALVSPTNKALDVIREKLSDAQLPGMTLIKSHYGYYKGHRIDFMTLSKLLSYKRFLDVKHNVEFRRGKKYRNIFDQYDIIIVDESSMLCRQNIVDITSDMRKKQAELAEGIVNGYARMLFIYDQMQLPPPKEKLSGIYKLEMPREELKTIVRTNKDNIKALSNLIRRWIDADIPKIYGELMKHRCDYIRIYQAKERDKFLAAFCKDNDGIILVWTNNLRKEYNRIIRDMLFGANAKNKYVVGERLIFNDFYKLRMGKENKTFYSSAPIDIIRVNVMEYKCRIMCVDDMLAKFAETMEQENMILSANDYMLQIRRYLLRFVAEFNMGMVGEFKIWEIYFSFEGVNLEYPLKTIYDREKYDREIARGRKSIRDFFAMQEADMGETGWPYFKTKIHEIVVGYFDEYYEQPFANIDYRLAMTIDKAQGSGFNSVFIDCADILDTNRHPYLDIDTAKRRFYTGISRAIERIYLLI